MSKTPALVVCMGVSGSGKTTLAGALARQFQLNFFEADDFHGAGNRAHMAAGRALDDSMREPWIRRLCETLEVQCRRSCDCVLAFSGLRRAHRQRLRELGFRTLFIHLEGEQRLIAKRLAGRHDHFMPSALLDSQFEDLEPAGGEDDVLALRIDTGLELLVEEASRVTKEFLQAGRHARGPGQPT